MNIVLFVNATIGFLKTFSSLLFIQKNVRQGNHLPMGGGGIWDRSCLYSVLI